VKKHYYAGATRLAVRIADGTLYYLLTDHLGSSNVTASTSGDPTTELRYYPYGEARYDAGSQKTAYRFTGQRIEDTLDLYYYGARWYDPVVGRFIQPDTVVPNPGNPQSLNRFSYGLNNPARYRDPTGHGPEIALGGFGGMGGGPIAPTMPSPWPGVFGVGVAAGLGQAQALLTDIGQAVTGLLQAYGPQLPAVMDALSQRVSQAGRVARQAMNQAGNTGNPGGVDPQDPLRGFRSLAVCRREHFFDKSTTTYSSAL